MPNTFLNITSVVTCALTIWNYYKINDIYNDIYNNNLKMNRTLYDISDNILRKNEHHHILMIDEIKKLQK